MLCASSDDLVERFKAGEVDLTLVSEGNEPRNWPLVALWRGPLVWITSTRYAPHRQDPLPLALAGPECGWRGRREEALDRAGHPLPHRLLSGTQAAPMRRWWPDWR